jgi:FMN hydrolase / 5-amino-6-(5-phospho-D-ribitylamino)uracil phosphatase
MRNVRAITLDLDDTLWAITPVIEAAEDELWTWLCRHYPRIGERFTQDRLSELRLEMAERHAHMAHNLRFLRKCLLREIAQAAGYGEMLVEPAFAVFDAARNRVELFPEVRSELQWLSERFQLVAVTNGNANLASIGIEGYFTATVSAEAVGAAKPARIVFDAAIGHAGVPPDDILHVGDHPYTDVEGARQAGLRTAWVNRHGYDWPDDVTPPDATVSDLRGLRALLESGVSP